MQLGKSNYRIAKIGRDQFASMSQEQHRVPVPLGRIGERRYWWFQERFYWDNDDLNQQEVYALLVTRQQRERQRIEMAQAIVAVGAAPRPAARIGIPDDVKQFVFARDAGRCRQCGAANDLQFDHVIPVALGGSSSADNLQLLCGVCNRRKGAGLTSGYPAPARRPVAPNTTSPQVPPATNDQWWKPSPPPDEPWWKQPGLES